MWTESSVPIRPIPSHQTRCGVEMYPIKRYRGEHGNSVKLKRVKRNVTWLSRCIFVKFDRITNDKEEIWTTWPQTVQDIFFSFKDPARNGGYF